VPEPTPISCKAALRNSFFTSAANPSWLSRKLTSGIYDPHAVRLKDHALALCCISIQHEINERAKLSRHMFAMWIIQMKRVVHPAVLLQNPPQLAAGQLLFCKLLEYETDTLPLYGRVHDRPHFVKYQTPLHVDLNYLSLRIELPF
jgi:hypothetical protein